MGDIFDKLVVPLSLLFFGEAGARWRSVGRSIGRADCIEDDD